MAPGQPPLANIVTLGVQDLGARRDFYRRLRWPQVLDSDDFAVFELRGALLALFPADKLASDARAEPGTGGGIRRAADIVTRDRAILSERQDEIIRGRLNRLATRPEIAYVQ